MAYQNLLQEVYLFKDMNESELLMINSAASLKQLNSGDDVFAQDDHANALYIIKFGSVRIHQKSSAGDNIEVAVLGTGSHFGEMSMVDGEKRSASVTAAEKTDIIEIKYSDLGKVLKDHPGTAVKLYSSLSHFLCGRLRITTNDLSFAREKNLRHF